MIVGNVLGYPIDTQVQRTERNRPAERPDVARKSPDFDTVMQPLAAEEPTPRTGPSTRLPDDDDSLPDRRLAEAENASNEPPAADDMSTALDSVRYGMIADDSRGETGPGTEASPADVRLAQAALDRITARQTASAEELLAANDLEGALTRSILDKSLAGNSADERLSLAASAALATALNASAANITTPVNDTAALDPELRARLARVIERMRSEFGHDVTVVETARSQERQNYLYAQGRSAGGNIVTWTTDSAHTQGEAADVVVDGSWQNPAGFARLQQVAKEEGLRTLGMRDPGHLELPKDAWTTSASVRVVSTASTPSAATGGIAGVAAVASVATVAGTAGAAGPGIAGASGIMLPDGIAAASNTSQSSSQQNANGGSRRGNSDTERARSLSAVEEESAERRAGRAARSNEATGTQNASPLSGETLNQSNSKFIGPVDSTERAAGASAVDRVESINTLREQQGSKPLSQITLEVDGPNGGTQQITVDVRGNTVQTHINTDGATADRLRANVDELRNGLLNRGLQPDSVRISAQGVRGSEAPEQVKAAADAMRVAGTAAPTATGAGDQPGQRERSTARDWDGRQPTRDEQRAQQRDEQRREAKQQGREGPQYQEKQ